MRFRNCRVIVGLGCTTLALLWFSSCGGSSGRSGSIPDVLSTQVPANSPSSSFVLPSPGTVLASPKSRIGSALVLERTGSEYEPSFAQHIAGEDASARFSPLWASGASSFNDLAYAIYSFSLQGYTGIQTLQLTWGEAPLDYANAWIGLSHWNRDCWNWHPGPTSGLLDLGATGFQPYIKPGTGEVLVAVVMIGTTQTLLDKLRVGGVTRSDWWMFGHDIFHNRRSLADGYDTPNLHWRYRTGGAVVSSPAFGADGAVYFGSVDGCVYALNPDCTVRWKYATSAPVLSSPAVLLDGTIYVGCDDGTLYAIRPDGSLQWAFTTGDAIYSSPAIGFDGTIYFGSDDGSIYAVNPNGTRRWEYPTGAPVRSSPAISGDNTIYIGSNNSSLYAMTYDGAMVWSFATGGAVQSSPAVGPDGSLYVGSKDGYLYAIKPDGSGYAWRYFTSSSFGVSSPALSDDGIIYIGAEDGYVYAINSDPAIQNSSLRLKWRFVTGSTVLSSPALDRNGVIYVGGQDGYIYALNPTDTPTGSLKWRYETGGPVASSPALSESGVIYVGCDDEFLYSFGASTSLAPVCLVSSNPPVAQLGENVAFDASPSYDPDGGNINKYEWDWTADGAYDQDTGATPLVTHAYAVPGLTTLRVRITDNEGKTGVATCQTIVNAPPVAALVADPTSIYPGTTITFDASGSTDSDGTIERYDWDFAGDGTYELTDGGSSPTHNYDALGSYDASVLVCDNYGATDTATVVLNVVPFAPASLLATDGLYTDKIVITWQAVSGVDGYKLQYLNLSGGFPSTWLDLTTVSSGSITEFEHTTTQPPGKGILDGARYEYRAKSVYGTLESLNWSNSDSGSVNAPPSAELTANPSIVYPGSTVNFDASGSSDSDGSIDQYDWDLDGDGTYEFTDGGSGPVQNYYELGLYNATVLVYDNNHFTDTASVAINVVPQPPEYLSATDGRYADKILVEWGVVSGADSYKLQYRNLSGGSPSSWTDLTVVSGGSTTEFDHTLTQPPGKGLLTNTRYEYRAKSMFGLLESIDWSTSDVGDTIVGLGDWFMFGREQTHNHRSSHICPQTNQVKWIYSDYSFYCTGYSSPAIGLDGIVYIVDGTPGLFAIFPDGTYKWSGGGDFGENSSPAIGGDGTIFFGSQEGGTATNRLIAYNPDGSLKWTCDLSYGIVGISSPMLASDGTIYIGDPVGFYAINPDGTDKWYYPSPISRSVAAISSDSTIYIGSSDHNMYAINADGTSEWFLATGGSIDSSPAIGSDGTVYIGSCDNSLYAINPNGTLKWSYPTGADVVSSPAIGSDGTVYVGSCDNNIYAINPDGNLKWSYLTGAAVVSSPAIDAEDTVFVGSDDSRLYAINSDGSLKWTYDTGDCVRSSPSIGGDGTIYVGSDDNSLYAIGPGGG